GVTLDGGLLGVRLLADRDLVLRKEPLRLATGHSAVAVVAPVNSAHVVLLFTWGAPRWPPTPPTLRAPAKPWRSATVQNIGTPLAKPDGRSQVVQEALQVVGGHRPFGGQGGHAAVERASHVRAVRGRELHQHLDERILKFRRPAALVLAAGRP